jgi:hypothetical protein
VRPLRLEAMPSPLCFTGAQVTRPKSKVRPTPEETLDNLTLAISAFPSFEAMVTACQGGYRPTLLPVGHHGKQNVRLAEALEARGCKVWRGMKVV